MFAIRSIFKRTSTALPQPYSGNTRIACAEPCEIADDDGRHQTGTVWNLSVAGVYLAVRPIVSPSQPLTLSFSLPGDPTPIRVLGRVAWWNPPSLFGGVGDRALHLPPGCGVEFLDLSARDRGRIEQRVRQTYPAGH